MKTEKQLNLEWRQKYQKSKRKRIKKFKQDFFSKFNKAHLKWEIETTSIEEKNALDDFLAEIYEGLKDPEMKLQYLTYFFIIMEFLGVRHE